MTHWRKWTEEQEAILRADWLAGKPVRSIGLKLNRRPHAVVVKANRMGLPPHVLVEGAIEPIPFEELDLIRLARLQRLALATLLEEHPFGVTAARLADRLFAGDDTVLRPVEMADGAIRRLSNNLKSVGWECRVTGDRTGYRLFRKKEEMVA